ncbi:MAG: SPFH domain-containing protein [Sphaerochaeta associata]|nr:SPFH domain-containing protein [Sphaerochaeta associata]MEA5028094.1 SPFH domain-containing protein [Sphaerochaeta associata]
MNEPVYSQEKVLNTAAHGLAFLLINTALIILCFFLFIYGVAADMPTLLRILVLTASSLYGFIVGPVLYAGLKIVKPNEALVLTLFGKYYGTLKKEGFFWVNPFVSAINPASSPDSSSATAKPEVKTEGGKTTTAYTIQFPKKKISLKAMTLNNDKQKVNDALGNPIIIGVVVIWKVVDTAKAVFSVDNYVEYLSIQCDSALRNVVRLFPYDSDEDEKSLRGSSKEVAQDLLREHQSKDDVAGLQNI